MVYQSRPLSSKIRLSKLHNKDSQENSKVKNQRNRVKPWLNCQKLPKPQILTRSLTVNRTQKAPIANICNAKESLVLYWDQFTIKKISLPKRMLRRTPTM